MNDNTEDIIALVYLLKENDDKNKCLLLSDNLLLIRKNIRYKISLPDINKITFHHKLFLFPIIAGGSLGPFFFIALLSGIFYPAVSLTGFLVSVVLLYIGFSGKKSLRIETINDVHEAFLPYISDNLKEFISFVNELIAGKNKEEIFTFYLPLDESQLTELKEKNELNLSQKGEYAINSRTFILQHHSPRHSYVKINFRDQNTRIKFEKDKKGMLKPKVYGRIITENEIVTPH